MKEFTFYEHKEYTVWTEESYTIKADTHDDALAKFFAAIDDGSLADFSDGNFEIMDEKYMIETGKVELYNENGNSVKRID